MGWAIFFGLALVAFAALALLRIDRRLWSMAGAALMLAAAGYAWQGSPGQPASPAVRDAEARGAGEAMIDLRSQMFGRFGLDGAYLTAADALSRSGSPQYEVQAILGGIRRDGTSVQLWTALGDALARHDRQLSPAAKLAFDHAAQLGPTHPGPPFFRGLALIRMNDFAGAEAAWRRALALTPADAPYRAQIAVRLEMLGRLRAATGS
jgi:tetratricopeptide (TPR) repeat protein